MDKYYITFRDANGTRMLFPLGQHSSVDSALSVALSMLGRNCAYEENGIIRDYETGDETLLLKGIKD